MYTIVKMADHLDTMVEKVREHSRNTTLILAVPGHEDPWFKDVKCRLPKMIGVKIEPGDRAEFYLGHITRRDGKSFVEDYHTVRVFRGANEVVSYEPSRERLTDFLG